MSDDLKKLAELAGGQYPRGVHPNAIMFYPKELDRFVELIEEAQAAEIIRLRAEVATAIKWRDAINDALTSWHNPVDEEETPMEAVDRLIGYETAWEKLSAPDEVAPIDAALAEMKAAKDRQP